MTRHENIAYVRAHVTNVSWYEKNMYCYVVSPDFIGHTIGSGPTLDAAWEMAREVIEDYVNESNDDIIKCVGGE